MNGAPIFSIRARGIAAAGNATVFSADFRTLKFHSAFRDFNTVTTHATAGRADWNPVIINGEVIFINRWSSTFAIKVDERCYIFTFAVLIVRHAKSHGNHVSRHKKNEETRAGRFPSPRACINHSRDNNSHSSVFYVLYAK